jgi:WD40 repeat protein
MNKKSSLLKNIASPILQLERVADALGSRIVVLAEDGSVKFLTPLSGSSITIALPPVRDAVITAARTCGNYLAMLNTQGELYFQNTSSNPSQLVGEWRNPDPGLGITALDLVAIRGQSDRKATSRMWECVYLVAGNANGQLVQVLTRSRGECVLLCQAHVSPVCQVSVDPERRFLLSAGTDRVLKLWSCDFRPGVEERHRLTHLHTLPHSVGLPTRICFRGPRALAIADDAFGVSLYHVRDGRLHPILPPSGERVERHAGAITGLDYLPSLDIFVSASADGSLKLWDHEGTVFRDIRYDKPVQSACFATAQGDLCMGLNRQLEVIPLQSYLPAAYQCSLLDLGEEVEREEMATSIYFDEELEFWKVKRSWDSLARTQEKVFFLPYIFRAVKTFSCPDAGEGLYRPEDVGE